MKLRKGKNKRTCVLRKKEKEKQNYELKDIITEEQMCEGRRREKNKVRRRKKNTVRRKKKQERKM